MCPNAKRSRMLFAVVSVFLFSFILLFTPFTEAATGVPQILSYQGRLLDASGNLLGQAGNDFCFQFSIYDDADVGGADNRLWPAGAGDPSTMTISVKNGIFNAQVGGPGGDTLDFDFQSNDTIYLNIRVASKVGVTCNPGDGLESFENLGPRQRILSSGYTINAKTVGGFLPYQSASSTEIPVLSSGNLILGGTNPKIETVGANTITLSGLAGLVLNPGAGSVFITGLDCSSGGNGGKLTTGVGGNIICSDDAGTSGGGSAWTTTTWGGIYYRDDVFFGSNSTTTAKFWFSTTTGNVTATGLIIGSNINLASTTN